MCRERLAHRLRPDTTRANGWARSSIIGALLLAGCAGQPAAPVADRSIPANADESGYRVVIPGDTLYSIAWEAGHDYQEVAAWNNISAPYRLYPGQKLRLTAPKATTQARAPTVERKPVAPKSEPKAAPARAPVKDKPRVTPRAKPADPPVRASNTRQASTDFGPWVWPAEGKILNYASPNGANKGLDIAGVRAQEIRAAAPGRVVYVGNGLRGYGLLVIIKHDDEFLSAYAHSDKVYVKEGDVIKRGEKIADMGSSGADRVKLHFEIRRRGVPVDPLQYLPKK